MLSKKERQQVLVVLCYFSKAHLFPIQVDQHSWEIRPGCNSKWRLWACKLAYAGFVAHALYKNLTLPHVVLFWEDVPLYQILIHGKIAGANVIVTF